MKVKIVTCPDVLPFEMNSGRVLVQLTKIKDNILYDIFLNHKSEGWVKSSRFSKGALRLCWSQAGHGVTQHCWAGGLLPCIPVLHTDQGRWMHKHLTVLFPAISALSLPIPLYSWSRFLVATGWRGLYRLPYQLQLSLGLSISERGSLKHEIQMQDFSSNVALLITAI